MMYLYTQYLRWKDRAATLNRPLLLWMLIPVFLVSVTLLPGCGKSDREIPKEETGEPNTVPLETQLYRDARSTFRSWVQLFQRPRVVDTAYDMLSSASVKRLKKLGIRDARDFSAWIEREAAKHRTPFFYEFSRFDILDIDVRDTTRAIITATFLVHIRQSSFESVSSFTLLREQGRWKIPFAESGNFENSWWQKEENFATRLREEGLHNYRSDSLSVSFRYPQAWDVNEAPLLGFAGSGNWPGIELEYVDPSTLHATAVIRIAVLPAAARDTVGSTKAAAAADSSAEMRLRLIDRSEVHIPVPLTMHGTLSRLQDPSSGRIVLFLTAVDSTSADYKRFSDTFHIVRRSIQLHLDDYLP